MELWSHIKFVCIYQICIIDQNLLLSQYFVLKSLANSGLPALSIALAIADHVGGGSTRLSQILNTSLRQLSLSLPRSAFILLKCPSSILSMMPIFSHLLATFVRSSVKRSLSFGFLSIITAGSVKIV